jgi:hypothetical protein
MKIRMVIRFGGYLTVWTVCVVFATIYLVVMPTWEFRFRFVEEAAILALFAIDIHMFFYQRKHGPDDGGEVETVVSTGRAEDLAMMYLAQPEEPYFVYLNRPQFMPLS